jgi:hypothetical protein
MFVLKERTNIVVQNGLVEFVLLVCYRGVKDVFAFLGKRMFHYTKLVNTPGGLRTIDFETPEKERFENEMEICDDFGFLFLTEDLFMSFFLIESREIEPAFKFVRIVKYFGQLNINAGWKIMIR